MIIDGWFFVPAVFDMNGPDDGLGVYARRHLSFTMGYADGGDPIWRYVEFPVHYRCLIDLIIRDDA